MYNQYIKLEAFRSTFYQSFELTFSTIFCGTKGTEKQSVECILGMACTRWHYFDFCYSVKCLTTQKLTNQSMLSTTSYTNKPSMTQPITNYTDKHSFTFSSQTMRTNLVLQSYHKLSSQTWLYALITSYTKKLSITQTIFISWHSLSKRSTTAFRLPLSHLEWVGISLTMAVKTQRLCPGTKAKSLKNAS